jgi:hypothetical protein
MLTRVWHARDWLTGNELSNHILGNLTQLQIHHIFPKGLLYKNGYSKPVVNAIANFTFLTQETNIYISDRSPDEYFEEIIAKNPGVLESHWIPMDKKLWKVKNYLEFLSIRRELLAQAANDFLNNLVKGEVPEVPVTTPLLERPPEEIAGGVESEDEEQLLIDTNIWIIEQGLPEGEMMYEVINKDTQKVLAILDLAWENGLQEGYSQPVALLIDESEEVEEIAMHAGFRYFTDVDSFKKYVKQEILALEVKSGTQIY